MQKDEDYKVFIDEGVIPVIERLAVGFARPLAVAVTFGLIFLIDRDVLSVNQRRS